MLTRKSIVSTGIAALMGLGILVTPTLAGAQSYRYRQNTSAENSSRTGALILGAAGLLLSAHHQSTLGTIALGGAAYETYQMQQQINQRHNQYGYYGGQYQAGDSDDNRYGYNNGYSYDGGSSYNNGNGYGYGYGRQNDSWYNKVTRKGDRDDRNRSSRNRDARNRSDRDRDGD